MEIHHLRYFVAVAETMSFRTAAKRLHISQPPLSRQIKALEAELGVQLLERSRNSRITITDVGRTFLSDARLVLKNLDLARHNAVAKATGLQGELVIGTFSSMVAEVLPICLRAYRQKYPAVHVSTVEMNGDIELTTLRTGRAQIALISDFGLELSPEFEARIIRVASVVAVMLPSHALAQKPGTEIELRELANETLLHLPSRHSPYYNRHFLELCEQVGINHQSTRKAEGVNNLLAMVTAGYGIALLPNAFGETLHPSFCVKRLSPALPPYRLHAVWLHESDSPTLKNFLSITIPAVTDDDATH